MNSENLQRLRNQVDVLLNFISNSNVIKELPELSISESESVEVNPEISAVQFNLISSNSPSARKCGKVFTVCPTGSHDSSPCTHAVDCRTGQLL